MSNKTNVLLWIGQIFLGLFFILASGAPKLLMPTDALPMPIPLSQGFTWFIGLCEVLGGLGLILPGLTRTQTRLTPLAAICLSALALCATVYQLMGRQPGNAVFALGMALICASVAYGRLRNPLPRRRSASVAQLA